MGPTDVWNSTASRGRVHVEWPRRKDTASWRLSLDEFALRDPPLQDLRIERRISAIPGAGYGMFATEMLQEREVVCIYRGTMRHLTDDEIRELEEKHTDDGNGVIQLDQAMGRIVGTPSVKARAWVIDPYEADGVEYNAETSPGIWANHCVRGRVGCNVKMVGRGKVGPNYQAFLVTTTCVPAGMELRWDYGVRDPAKPWLN